MNFSVFETTAFANYQHMMMVIARQKTYNNMAQVIHMGVDTYAAFYKWPEVSENAKILEYENDLGVVGTLHDVPVVVEGNGGMQLVLIPKDHETYLDISTQLPDEEPEDEVVEATEETEEDKTDAVGELEAGDEEVSENDEQQQ